MNRNKARKKINKRNFFETKKKQKEQNFTQLRQKKNCSQKQESEKEKERKIFKEEFPKK